jgi:hypothetical protein
MPTDLFDTLFFRIMYPLNLARLKFKIKLDNPDDAFCRMIAGDGAVLYFFDTSLIGTGVIAL